MDQIIQDVINVLSSNNGKMLLSDLIDDILEKYQDILTEADIHSLLATNSHIFSWITNNGIDEITLHLPPIATPIPKNQNTTQSPQALSTTKIQCPPNNNKK